MIPDNVSNHVQEYLKKTKQTNKITQEWAKKCFHKFSSVYITNWKKQFSVWNCIFLYWYCIDRTIFFFRKSMETRLLIVIYLKYTNNISCRMQNAWTTSNYYMTFLTCLNLLYILLDETSYHNLFFSYHGVAD